MILPERRDEFLIRSARFTSPKRRLTWPNGAVATTYSADEPERLRGPQHDAAWCDELAPLSLRGRVRVRPNRRTKGIANMTWFCSILASENREDVK